MKTCSICQRDFTEYGNNAWPVNEGTCCNECDWLVVTPARLRRPPGFLGNYENYLEAQERVREQRAQRERPPLERRQHSFVPNDKTGNCEICNNPRDLPVHRIGGRDNKPKLARAREIVAHKLNGKTLKEISKKYKISPERVRQIIAREERRRRA